MKIGHHKLCNQLILAPMAGVTDRPFRQLCRRLGAGLAVSEMVTADTSLWGSKKSLLRLDHQGETGPVAVQILGADPQKMAMAARINVDRGADIIDINMGCPAKKVCRVAAGSALMRDEKLVSEILLSTVKAVDVPVTLKIRTGWDHQQRNAVKIALIAEQSGVAAVTIHGRTRADRFTGEAEYGTIRTAKQRLSIPVIANGDIDSPQKAKQVLAYTGADAIMIGRAAQGRPWIFDEIQHYLQTGHLAPARSSQWICSILLEHLEELYRHYGTQHGVQIARKHIGWYSRSHPDSAEFRKAVFLTESPDAQQQMIRDYFLGQEQAA
ncbi:MAG TPA: tRNA dihydrouridine synthase DusB [Gammaproteobacteria bacterium]|nr:tRNA dihydrouridine synthase DusB [Gammaproteobacteria bacterium]